MEQMGYKGKTKEWMMHNIKSSKLKILFKKEARIHDPSLQHIPVEQWNFTEEYCKKLYKLAKQKS